MLPLNLPDVVAELTSAFEKYESALVANDFKVLNELFWRSEHTLRFGTKEQLYGHQEIADFRIQRGKIDQRRKLHNVRIVTFGRDFGIANTEFIPFGSEKIGRQSQIWVRTDEGWRIVSAHVSFSA
jgi:hypothetical protein